MAGGSLPTISERCQHHRQAGQPVQLRFADAARRCPLVNKGTIRDGIATLHGWLGRANWAQCPVNVRSIARRQPDTNAVPAPNTLIYHRKTGSGGQT